MIEPPPPPTMGSCWEGQREGKAGNQTRLHKASSVILSGSLCLSLKFLSCGLDVFGEDDGVGIGEQGLGIG